MVYPAIIGLMAVGTTTFLLTFVLPKFTVMFKGKEAILPTPTLVLIAISFFIRTYWYVVIGGIIAMVVGLIYAVRTPLGRQYWDAAKLRIPIFKAMFSALYITRSLYTMGELIVAGVPMLDTLSITAQVSGNALYRRMWGSVQKSVKQGTKIAVALEGEALMPRSVLQMIAAGEESGRLGDVLRNVSEYYAKKLQSTIKTVTSLIEPMMILIMGAVVGFIAMSIALPIFTMSTLAK
jgi:type IV pilus assembly protein PilC